MTTGRLTEAMDEVVATTEGLAEVAQGQFSAVLEGVDLMPEESVGKSVIGILRQRLMDGRINGERYWEDGCGCPLGTIAFFDGADDPVEEAQQRPVALTYALEDWARPICPGCVPDHTAHEDTGPFRAAVLVSWIDEFARERSA